MVSSVPKDASLRARLFSAWGVALWIVLLQAASGVAQYATSRQWLPMVVPAIVIVISAGCILRQEWARRIMRVLAPLLALLSLYGVAAMARQWGQFELARQNAQAMVDPALVNDALELISREQHAFAIGLAIKALMIPLLLWLAWKLGQPMVREQFGRR